MPRGHTIDRAAVLHKGGMDAASAKVNTLGAAVSKARQMAHDHPEMPGVKQGIMALLAGLTGDVMGPVAVEAVADAVEAIEDPAPKKGKKSE